MREINQKQERATILKGLIIHRVILNAYMLQTNTIQFSVTFFLSSINILIKYHKMKPQKERIKKHVGPSVTVA